MQNMPAQALWQNKGVFHNYAHTHIYACTYHPHARQCGRMSLVNMCRNAEIHQQNRCVQHRRRWRHGAVCCHGIECGTGIAGGPSPSPAFNSVALPHTCEPNHLHCVYRHAHVRGHAPFTHWATGMCMLVRTYVSGTWCPSAAIVSVNAGARGARGGVS